MSFQGEKSASQPSQVVQQPQGEERKRGLAFWMVIAGINTCSFFAFLEGTILSTALPTIVNTLHGADFVWIQAAYNLAAAAVMPSTGALAQIFGRRAILMASLVAFLAGCAVCGAAQSTGMLVGGRVIQGLGGGGIFTIATIITSDIVPLSERGAFNSFYQLTWCVASAIGPVVGGTLAKHGQWRWIFFLNLPIIPVAGLMATVALRLKVPQRSLKESLEQMDLIGNIMVISGACLFTIGILWGGVQFPWNSAHVIAPLCIGSAILIAFMVYECTWSRRPLMPLGLMQNRTTLSGYLQTMIIIIPFSAVVYYVPIYFQACKGSSPIRSGVLLFGLAFSTPPLAIVAGVVVTITKRYRIQLWVGWVITIAGLVLLGTTHKDTTIARFLGYEIFVGVGFGIVLSSTYFPVLAPLSFKSIASALAFFSFLRQFFQIVGISVGGAILQNQLTKNIPTKFASLFPQGGEAINVIPQLQTLSPPDLQAIQTAFADSLGTVWYAMAGIAGLGFISSLMMKHYELHTRVDADWNMKEKELAEKTLQTDSAEVATD